MISIVMPNYNKESWISDSIESCLNQIYKDWELVIVDDASTDNSRRIIDYYAKKDSRIKPIYLGKNVGIGAARNVGSKAAEGEILAVHDSDDFMQEDRLKEIAKAFKTGKCDVFYSNYVHTNIVLEPMISEDFTGIPVYDLLYPKQKMGHLTMAYWKKVWEKHPYDEARRYNDDYPLLISLYNDHSLKFYHCKKYLCAMRLLINGASLSNLDKTKDEDMALAETIIKRV